MIDRKYLPSKNFLIALLIAITVIAVTILLDYLKPETPLYQNTVANASSTAPWVNNIDSDSDGLPDWQEVLYITDAKKADTDSDGTSDGDEIKNQRDPLKANTAKTGGAPTDKIDPDIIAQEKQITAALNEDLNATEKLARNLMSNIFASQPIQGSMNAYTAETLVAKTFSDIPKKEFSAITKEKDLNFKKVDTETLGKDLATYANAYYKETEILKKNLGKDLLVVNNYSTDADATAFKAGILEVISTYKNMVLNLVKMPLPAVSGSSGAIYHLALINNLEKLIAIDNDIMNSANDGISIYADLYAYSNAVADLTSTLQIIDSVFNIKRTN